MTPEECGLPPYPNGDIVGACVCGSWPGGRCLMCKVVHRKFGRREMMSDKPVKAAGKVYEENCRLRAEVASLKEEQRKDSADMLRLIADIRYVAGIAERGRGKPLGDGEKFTQAVLDYVKSLESQLASLKEEAQEDARDALAAIARGDARSIATADQCSHGKFGYEDCELCICEFADAALDEAMSVKSEDARDAERYRHMRKSFESSNSATSDFGRDPKLVWYLPQWDRNLPWAERLDAALDAAIAISAQEKTK